MGPWLTWPLIGSCEHGSKPATPDLVNRRVCRQPVATCLSCYCTPAAFLDPAGVHSVHSRSTRPATVCRRLLSSAASSCLAANTSARSLRQTSVSHTLRRRLHARFDTKCGNMGNPTSKRRRWPRWGPLMQVHNADEALIGGVISGARLFAGADVVRCRPHTVPQSVRCACSP